MSEETSTGQRSPRRTFSVLAYGNTADEMEMFALDAAREFFGSDVRLELDRNYGVQRSGFPPKGEKYMGTIYVRTLEDDR